mmetsp:Transcript_37542/g.104396  ORF Transcript_37542/g.104396 Transcript_37542/m.104396 type:complete len:250 (-) Transcript_37542:177-926(-)
MAADRLLPEDVSRSSAQREGLGPQMAVRSPERYTLVVMGRARVGKTAITVRYTSANFVQVYEPTIEDKHVKHTTIASAPACLEIIDTSGDNNYRSLRRCWMKDDAGNAGFLFVFSLVDRQTFDELEAFREELMDLYHDDPPPSVLVANKADIDRVQWVVTDDEVRGLRTRWHNCFEVVYTSASSGLNVAEAFEPLCAAVRERVQCRRRAAREREAAVQRQASLSADGSRCRCRQCRLRLAQCVGACGVS